MAKMLGKTKTRLCHDGPLVGGLLLPAAKERRANRAVEAEETRAEIDEQRAESEGGEDQ
jgi:hypothetical protein